MPIVVEPGTECERPIDGTTIDGGGICILIGGGVDG